MYKLVSLELRKHNIRTYLQACVLIAVLMLGFLYLFAYVPSIDNDPDMQIFKDYMPLISMGSALNMAVFTTLSSVMASRFIIEPYKGKQVYNLFSYPLSRTRMMLAKLICVYGFTAGAFFICNVLLFLVFGLTEPMFSLMSSSFSMDLFGYVLLLSLIISFISAGSGMIAAGIGFIKKSVPTTIVSAVLLSSLFNNLIFYAANANHFVGVSSLFMLITLVLGVISSYTVVHQINEMDV
ncbi:ABC transporter permease [Paenibacillus sp. BR2-3]|uniref:ABC transporter permease n=1 Tax=Paenibacillus sp. BR2-3 TaxID=3048494 RepID=UPI003977AA07